MALFGKAKPKKKVYIKSHHFLFVEKDFHKIADDILHWSWSAWWPKDNALQYVVDGNEPESGKACELILKSKFLTAVIEGEITQIRSNRVLQITWKSGMMTGQEFVLVEERSNGTRVDHRARYSGTNAVFHMVWKIFFQKKYDDCIQQSLDALKQFIMD